jgi:hypothetical protein
MFGHVVHSNAIKDLVHKDEIRQQKMHHRVDQFIKRSRMKDERDIHNIHIAGLTRDQKEARRKTQRKVEEKRVHIAQIKLFLNSHFVPNIANSNHFIILNYCFNCKKKANKNNLNAIISSQTKFTLFCIAVLLQNDQGSQLL